MSCMQRSGGIALLPFLVFVLTFLGAGIGLGDFYAFPSPVAVGLGIIVAFLLLKGSVQAKVDALIRGCGESRIMTMCLIYLLAGAFATVSKAMGGVDATVNLGLMLIPVKYLALGIFLLGSFLSTATGTSVGCIVALGPIAVGLAEQSQTPMPLMLGSLLGGAMFGDNLSFISDTTIAATQSQDCSMKDKFKVNILIAGPAALLTILFLLLAGQYATAPPAMLPDAASFSFWPILPYLLVIGLAVWGLNVFVVLTIGTLAAGLIGFATGSLQPLLFAQKTYEGFTSMIEIFLLSMLTGGLAEMVREAGGIDYLVSKIRIAIGGHKSAQLGIGALVSGTNTAIANNTVSIVVTGPVTKEISRNYGVDKRKTAALTDIFSCVTQGLLPYGAQVLILVGFTKSTVSFTQILPYAWYLYLLLACTLLAIYTPFVDRYLNRQPTAESPLG